MLQVTWSSAHALATLDLSSIRASGVYLIWHQGQPAQMVRVGQGDVADRLRAHRADPAILAHGHKGLLWARWAAVPYYSLDGVERYLAELYRPLVGDRFPNVAPIAVNSPW
jgi:hypothetical protein